MPVMPLVHFRSEKEFQGKVYDFVSSEPRSYLDRASLGNCEEEDLCLL